MVKQSSSQTKSARSHLPQPESVTPLSPGSSIYPMADWEHIAAEQRIRAKHLHVLQMKLDLIEVNQRLRQIQRREKELAIRGGIATEKSRVKRPASQTVVFDEPPRTGNPANDRENVSRAANPHKGSTKRLVRTRAIRRPAESVYSVPAKLWSGKEPVGLRRFYGVGKPAVRLSSGNLISNRSRDTVSRSRRTGLTFKTGDVIDQGTVKAVNLKRLTVIENRLDRLSLRVEEKIDLLVPSVHNESSFCGSSCRTSSSMEEKVVELDMPQKLDQTSALGPADGADALAVSTGESSEVVHEPSSACSEKLTEVSPVQDETAATTPAQTDAKVQDESAIAEHGAESKQQPASESEIESLTKVPTAQSTGQNTVYPNRRSAACQTSFTGYKSTEHLVIRPRRPVYSSVPKRLVKPVPILIPTASQESLLQSPIKLKPSVSHDELTRLTHRLSSTRIEGKPRVDSRMIRQSPRRTRPMTINKPLPYYNTKSVITASVDSLAPASSVDSLLLPPPPISHRRRIPRKAVPSPLNPNHQKERVTQRASRQRIDSSSVSLGMKMNAGLVYDKDRNATPEAKKAGSRIKRLVGREGRAKLRLALFGV